MLGDPWAPPSAARKRRANSMEVLYARCCGLDVHKKSVVACLLISQLVGEPVKTIRTFGTMTADLLALADGRFVS
jgi:hypothetical protein